METGPLVDAAPRRPAKVSKKQATRPVVIVSRMTFITIWWCLQLVHVISIAFAACVIGLCRFVIANNMWLMMSFVGDDAFWFLTPTIITCAVLIVGHSAALFQSVWASLRHREWQFKRKPRAQKSGSTRRKIPDTTTPATDNTAEGPFISDVPVTTKSCCGFVTAVEQVTSMFFSFQGKHYDATFFVLEIVEIGFQTYQTYKLSTLVPRIWINRVVAVVLVANCWSTVVVHTMMSGRSFAKRILLVAVDAAFDLITSLGIPAAILAPYYRQFDFQIGDFPFHFYYDDVWFIQAMSENRQLFVMSWLDFVSKLTPFAAIFGAVMILKTCFVMDTSVPAHRRVTSATGIPKFRSFTSRWWAMSSQHRSQRVARVLPAPVKTELGLLRRPTGTEHATTDRPIHTRYKYSWHDGVFLFGGAIVLAIHIHTSLVGNGVTDHMPNCLLAMRPWLSTRPSCATFEVNCARGEHTDGADDKSLNDLLGRLNPRELKAIVFSGCQNLHIPSRIQTFSALEMLKIYNSTVHVWDQSAELHNDLHRELMFLFVGDSNFTDGQLPVGVRGNHFPTSLVDVEFSGTNLVGLPADLHLSWVNTQVFALERTPAVVAFPETLAKSNVVIAMLRDNGILSIPDALLADCSFQTLLLNRNPLVELPRTIGKMGEFYRIDISFTNFAVLPEWLIKEELDSTTGRPIVPIWGSILLLAEGTILCDNHVSTTTPRLPIYLELACSPVEPTLGYPIDHEREWRARSQTLFM